MKDRIQFGTSQEIKKSRKQAITDGDYIYWSGRQCLKGHLTWRYTRTGACTCCQKNREKTFSNGKDKGMSDRERNDIEKSLNGY